MRLQDKCREISRELHRSEIGKSHRILIEGPSKKDPSRFTGRTSQNVPCHLSPEDSLRVKTGDLVEVLIEDGTLTHLTGRLVSVPNPNLSKPEVHAEAR